MGNTLGPALPVALLASVVVALACGGQVVSSDAVDLPAEPEDGPAFAIVLAGDDVLLSEAKQQVDASEWTEKEALHDVPGTPGHYEVHAGGGEGDCAIDALQFDAEGAMPTRLFFMASCFGDTSEETVSPVSLEDDRFALRSDHSFIKDARMNDDGTWTGEPAHTVTDRIYRWTPDGLAFVEEHVHEGRP